MWQKIWQKIEERWRFLRLPYGQVAYGQNAEDLVLAKFLDARLKKRQLPGFYIDVGAHHPFRYSNTYYFYQRGWTGLNIDADSQAVKLLKDFRPRDINIEALVGEAKRLKKVTYYVFNDRAFNTSDSLLAREIIKSGRATLLKKEKLPVQNLSNILEKYLNKDQKIDFMSIDVEGFDYSVLKSNDFNRFRPNYLLIEDLAHLGKESLITSKESKKITLLLKKQGYSLVSRVFNTAIWQYKKLV